MKKKVFSLMMMLLLAVTGFVRADELTVHDGTATNAYVPVYGFYADAYLKCEMVYPASELSAMNGGQINSLTFGISSPATDAWTATFEVFVKEVSDATISDFTGTTGATTVYTGTLDGTGSTMTVNFTAPYTYNGGNLLVGFYTTTTGNYKSVTWAGETVSGASVQGYNYSSLSGVTASQRDFLPKTTFDYTPGASEVSEIIDFEEGALPEGWTVEGDANWTVGVGDYHTSTGTHSGSYNAKCTHTSRENQTYLVSPMFDFSNASAGTVNCWFVNRSWGNDIDYFGVYYRVNGGAWQQLYYTTAAHSSWTEMGEIQLTGFANNYQIGFLMYDNYGYGVGLDDIEINVTMGEGPAYEVVDAIEINDFVAPVWGEPVTQDVTIPEDANYSLMAATWFTLPHGILPGREINPDPIYNLDDMDYIWGFILLPNEGYAFNPALEAYINGSSDLVLLARVITPEDAAIEPELPVGAAVIYTYAYYTYEEGLHTLSTYGVGEGEYESIDRLLIERPNGAWMEPYHFQLYNDGANDVEVVLIDFLHNNGYFSMAEGTEYPFDVTATGRPGVDLYINTNIDWTDTEEINSLLAVNTSERSTHLYPIIAAPYTPYCPDVVETAYRINGISGGMEWSMWTAEMWNQMNPNVPYELHDNYTLPFPEIPEGYDAVMTFTLNHDMMLNAAVTDGECDGALNGKVALYRKIGDEPVHPMADNYYDGRPFHNDGGAPVAYSSIDFETGNFSQFNSYNNTSAYSWTVSTEAAHGGTYGMMSGNRGISSSTSTFSATVNYTTDGTVSFDYNARGEGSGSYIWDKCIFKIDGAEQFRYGAVNAWNSFSANVTAGEHTFTWIYEKDSSVNPTGDAFYVDNIVFDGGRMVAGNRDIILHEDFDGIQDDEIPAGWTVAGGDDIYGETWFGITSSTFGISFPSGTNGAVMSASYWNGSCTPDNWLISPNVQGATMVTYTYAVNTAYAGDHYALLASSTGTNLSDFSVVYEETPTGSKNGGYRLTADGHNDRWTASWVTREVNLPAGTKYVAFHHYNCYDMNFLLIDEITFEGTTTPVDPDQPTEHTFTAGPVIEGLNLLAGTYYLVASSTCENFEVSINFEELPCPIEAVTGIYPEDNAFDIPSDNLTLRWTLNDYANEWRIVFGSTYYPEDEPNHPATYISEWSSDLQESLRITDYVNLWNNTNYFWRIEQRSNPGTPYECVTSGPVFGFTTSLNAPTNLQASNTRIFEYEETVTLSWTPIQDRTYRRYRIYMDGELIHQTPNNQVVTSWDVPQDLLTYNMYNEQGYIFEVSAVYDEGESPKSNTAEIWVSGNGTVSGTVYEHDETTPIGGVTVTLTGTNEFGQTETYVATTEPDGTYEIDVHAGTYGYAVATMEGYQNAETIHELPFDVVYDEETDHVDFIMDELFIAPAHVCAQTSYVPTAEGDTLVQVWWDFNFFTTLFEDFETGDFSQFAWQNGGTYPWQITTDAYEGSYAMKSGNAGHHSTDSEIQVTLDIPQDGEFSFWSKAGTESSTSYWDYGVFYLDGVQIQRYLTHDWTMTSMPITAGTHTFKWSFHKDSSDIYTTEDCMTIDNITFVGRADDRANRSLHHYNIYRTDCYNDGPYNSDNTTFLASAWRPDTSYFDVQWPEVPVGVYKWGVSAVYAGNYDGNPNNPRIDYPFEERESEIVWSNQCNCGQGCIDKDMYLDSLVTVNVVLNSADSPEGVHVDFVNLNEGEQFNHPQEGIILDQTGYYVFPRFRKGDYLVTVSLPGYYTIEVEESIWEPRDLRYVLIEIICKVQNLYVSRTGWAMWDPQEPCPGGAEPTPDPTTGETYTYNFEGDYQGWTNIINGEGNGWHLATEVYTGVDGYGANGSNDFMMGSSYISYLYESYDCDDYLVSPQAYAIGNGASLSFYHDVYSDSYPDYMEVCVSTAATPTAASFTSIWNNGGERRANGNANRDNNLNFSNRMGNWTLQTLDLSAYAGQNVWIAFHHEAYDQWAIMLDDVTVTTAGGRAVTEERHLEGYKVMCTSIDGEPIFNHNTPADQPFCQVATDELVEGNHYIVKVAAIYSTGMSEYEEAEWQYESCEHYAGSVNGLTVEGNTVSWDYPGGDPTPDPDPEPTDEVTVVLNVPGDPWQDGSGYQLILDADHNQYGNQIPASGNFTAGSFAEFEYTVPENAVCDLNTNTIVLDGSATITIPAGVYDYAFLNPSPDYGTYYISSNYGQFPGRGDDFEFEGGKTYTFTVTVNNYDNITLVITDNDGRAYGFACNMPAASDNSQYRRAENVVNATVIANSMNLRTPSIDNRDGWLYYDNGTVSSNILGLSNQSTGEIFPFSFGVMFPAGSYQGNTLTKAAYYDPAANTGNIEIYQGGTTAPTTLVYSQPYSTTGAEDFVEFTFTTPVTIDPAQSLWVVFHTDGGFVAALDSQAGNANGMWLYSDLLSEDWQTVVQATGGAYNGNWMIRAYVEEGTTPTPTPSEGILGAMIFVDGEWEAFVEAPTNSYTYEGEGENICVRIVYDGTAQLPENNFYYAMSCEECTEDLDRCPAGAPIYGDVDVNDQVHIWWANTRTWHGKIEKYNVYRSNDNVNYALIGEVPTGRDNLYEYFDTPVAGGTYYYQVTAVYSDGCESDPAISGENPDQNFLMFGITGIGENSADVNLFPNPTKGNVTSARSCSTLSLIKMNTS